MEKKTICNHKGNEVVCEPFKEVEGFATNFHICTRCGSILRLRSSENNKYSEATSNEILNLFEAIESKIKDEKDPRLAPTDTLVTIVRYKLLENISKSIELSGYTVIKGAIRKFIKYKYLKIAIEYLIAHNVFAETAKNEGYSVAYKESGIPVATQKSKEEKDDVKMDKEIKIGYHEEFSKFVIEYKLKLDTRGRSKEYEDTKSHTWERLYTFKPFADGRESVVIEGCKTCGKIVAYYDNSRNLIDCIDALILAESKYADKYKDNLLDMQKRHCTKLAEKRIDEARKVAKETGVPVLTAAQKLNEEKDDVKMDKEIKVGSQEEIDMFVNKGLKLGAYLTHFPYNAVTTQAPEKLIKSIKDAKQNNYSEFTAKNLGRIAQYPKGFTGNELASAEVYINGYSDGSVAVWYNDLQSAFEVLKYLNISIIINKKDKDIVIFEPAIARLTNGLFQNLIDEYMEEANKRKVEVSNYNNNIEPTDQKEEPKNDDVKLADAINSSAAKADAPFSEHAEKASSILMQMTELAAKNNEKLTDEEKAQIKRYNDSIAKELFPQYRPEISSDERCVQKGTLQDIAEKLGSEETEDLMQKLWQEFISSQLAQDTQVEQLQGLVDNRSSFYPVADMAEEILDLRRAGFADTDIIKHFQMEIFIGSGFQSADALNSKAQLEELLALCYLRSTQIFRYATEDNGRGIFDEEELEAPIDITIS